ncbi:uncharacterized protein LOC108599147 [Drosophila busckii]|uniref:uncharacterized protein LOC108599147 n=1 Tax=Drosophila busckii TaxID=30019 RepID=UPI00083EA573|nr:uncharacterized protein LOC108599147 [Drosophila busckii]
MAQKDSNGVIYNIVKDPALVQNRIYLGNLPLCSREELENICHPYGKVLGSLVQKKFGFVQFESEEEANKCAAALNRSSFKSNYLTVRNAGLKLKEANTTAKKTLTVQGVMPGAATAAAAPINDCEIIVVNRNNTKYAEIVEDNLRQVGMRVDVLFPNEDVTLEHVLSNIAARGCLYAVLVSPENEVFQSITVNILQGVLAEHRNMPLNDAITLMTTEFFLKKQRVAEGSVERRHPGRLQQLIEMLADNQELTALQYECIIKYLKKQHEKQLKLELCPIGKLRAPDPEIELNNE